MAVFSMSGNDPLSQDIWETAAERLRRGVRSPRQPGLATNVLENAVPAVAGGLAGAFTAPGKIYQGTTPTTPGLWSEEDEFRQQQNIAKPYEWAPEMAVNLFGVGTPLAASGAAGIFGGRLAKTADLAKLKTAEEMAAAGSGPTAIHDATGWHQGPDKQWRFEIDDSLSHMKGTGTVSDIVARRGQNVGSAFYHPDLYKAYPEMKDMWLQGSPGSGGSFGSAQHPSINSGEPFPAIQIGDLAKDRRSTMLHELQHAVQEREGFARGGSPREFALEADKASKEIEKHNASMSYWARTLDNARAAGKPEEELTGLRQLYDRAMKARDELVPKATLDPLEGYVKLAGEVEARNVQVRRDLSKEKREYIPPKLSQDIPDEAQIVRMRAGSMAPQASMSIESPYGARVWHGSPHDFDRFDMSKIGTGEGSQVFGHGLYLAENPAVAKSYRDNLSSIHDPRALVSDAIDYARFENPTGDLSYNMLAKQLTAHGLTRDLVKNDEVMAKILRAANGYNPKDKTFTPAGLRALKETDALLPPPNPGRLYEVGIKAPPDRFLNWDRPMGEQSNAVIDAVRPILKPVQEASAAGRAERLRRGTDAFGRPLKPQELERLATPPKPFEEITGETAYGWAGLPAKTRDEGFVTATGKLREAGVPGIKFLDQHSRAAQRALDLSSRPQDLVVPPMTSNYVAFDDKILDILKKYGIAGLLGGGAAAFRPDDARAQ